MYGIEYNDPCSKSDKSRVGCMVQNNFSSSGSYSSVSRMSPYLNLPVCKVLSGRGPHRFLLFQLPGIEKMGKVSVVCSVK